MLFVTGLVLLASTHPVLSVSAGNFGSDPDSVPGVSGTQNGVWLTNNANWIVGRRALTTKYFNGVTNAVLDEYRPTDLDPTLLSPDSCPDSTYDVCVFDSDYGNNGLNGWNQCAGDEIGNHPNQVCTLAFDKINLRYDPPAKRIACHEMGHGVGLRHTQNDASCMKRTQDGGTSNQLTDHDAAHLDGEY